MTTSINRRQAAIAVVSAGMLPVGAMAREINSQPIKGRDAVPNERTAILIGDAIFEAQTGRNAGVDTAPTIYTAELQTDATYGEVWVVHLRQNVINHAAKEGDLIMYFIAVIGKRDARLWEFRLEQ